MKLNVTDCVDQMWTDLLGLSGLVPNDLNTCQRGLDQITEKLHNAVDPNGSAAINIAKDYLDKHQMVQFC